MESQDETCEPGADYPTTCPKCAQLQSQVQDLKTQLADKESQLEKTEAKLLKTEQQLKRSTEIGDKLLLKIQKFSVLNQMKNGEPGEIKEEEETTKAEAAVENVWAAKTSEGTAETETGAKPKTPPPSSSQPSQSEQPTLASQPTLADELKSAAQSVCDQQGYVYDQRTGMYYDYNSGYYYDNEQSLFFDPASGTYFYYEAETQQYKFHSQIDVSQLHARQAERQQKWAEERDRQSNGHRRHKRKHGDESDDVMTTDRKEKKRKKKRKKEKKEKRKRKKRKHSKHSDEDHHDKKRSKKKKKRKEKKKKETAEAAEESPPEGDLEIDLDVMETEVQSDQENQSETPLEAEPISDPDREEGELSDASELSSISEEMLRTPSSLSQISSTSESESESSSESESESENESEDVKEKSKADEWEEFCKQSYAPCIRAMVVESDHLAAGGLHVVTTTGGTLGREQGLGHVLVIPDPLISKMHCSLSYDAELKRYTITDHASQNGTTVNGERIGQAKVISDPKVLHHGDMLQVGSSRFCLHIHPGRETCEACEPGLVQAKMDADAKAANTETMTSREDREAARRKQLKNIRRKFGLEKEPYHDESASLGAGYQDKAAERRRVKGSDNPYQRDDPGASVTRAISSENKGHKLLAKMGWKEGQSLGKSDDGIREPINVQIRAPGSGLGLEAAGSSLDSTAQSRQQLERKIKTQIRFNQIDKRKVADKPACFVKPGDEVEEGDENG